MLALIKTYRGTRIVRVPSGFAFKFGETWYEAGSVADCRQSIDALRLERTLQLCERS
jgi:hypothetical protein